MEKWLRKLGYLYNIAKGCESIANQMAHLVVGVLSGLPLYAVSLRVSIGLSLGALLELPTGVLADVIGLGRALGYGCAVISVAIAGLFFACHYSAWEYSLHLLIISSVLSACGGALVSGCFQAFVQSYIDRHATVGDENIGSDELKLRALSLAQRYGNFFSALLPTLVLALVLTMHKQLGNAEFGLLVPAGLYVVMSVFFFRASEKLAHKKTDVRQHWAAYRGKLRIFANQIAAEKSAPRARFLLLFLVTVISIITVIHVHTYLMISQLRNIDIEHGGWRDLAAAFVILASFDMAHYFKGYIVPRVATVFSSRGILYFSFASQFLLAAVALLAIKQGYDVAAPILFVLLFRAVFSSGQNTLQAELLESVPEELRASVFSLVQIFVLVVYALYSAALTFKGVGVDALDTIFVQLAVLSLVSLVLVWRLEKFRDKKPAPVPKEEFSI